MGDTDLELVEEEQKIVIAPARISGPSIPAPRSNLHSVIADYFPKRRRMESPSWEDLDGRSRLYCTLCRSNSGEHWYIGD